jgi:hypothetical protein
MRREDRGGERAIFRRLLRYYTCDERRESKYSTLGNEEKR